MSRTDYHREYRQELRAYGFVAIGPYAHEMNKELTLAICERMKAQAMVIMFNTAKQQDDLDTLDFLASRNKTKEHLDFKTEKALELVEHSTLPAEDIKAWVKALKYASSVYTRIRRVLYDMSDIELQKRPGVTARAKEAVYTIFLRQMIREAEVRVHINESIKGSGTLSGLLFCCPLEGD